MYLAYFGQHKCGSNWIDTIVRQVCQSINITYGRAWNSSQFAPSLDEYILEHGIQWFSYVNADYQIIHYSNFKAFHVIRDPRDIVVSAYFSHLKTHPIRNWPLLAEFRKKLQNCRNKDEGISMEFEFEFTKDIFRRLREWDLNDPRIKNYRLEDISVDYINRFRQIFQYMGLFELGLTEERFQQIMIANSFEKISEGRKIGKEDPNHHYRKGIHGDWKNHFANDHVDYFKEHYNDILIKYGYEKDANWNNEKIPLL